MASFYLVSEKTDKEIVEIMCLRQKTIEIYREYLFEKLEAKSDIRHIIHPIK